MKNLLSIISFVICCFGMNAQNRIETKLGQSLIVNDDHSYEFILTQSDGEKLPIDPFEVPKAINDLDDASKLKLTKLTDHLLEMDGAYATLLFLSNFELKSTQTALEMAKGQSNAALTKNFSVGIDSILNLIEATNKDYNALVKDYISLGEIKNTNSEKAINEGVNLIYQKYFNEQDAPLAKSGEVRVIKKTKMAIDTRNPWEIVDEADTMRRSLFTYTPEKLKNYYKNNHLLEVFAKFIDDRTIAFDFVFSSKDVEKGYGQINRGDFMRIDFLKGQSISLKSVKDVVPTLESYTGNTVYKAIYKIKNKEDYKKLTTSLLDAIGVMWSSGFESYAVYNIDFFNHSDYSKQKSVTGK